VGTAMNLPSAIARYLITLAIEQRDLAYLQVSLEGHILSSGGLLTKYSLEKAKVGDAIDQHLLFLAGFFPHPPENEVMQYIQTEQGYVVNVHFITCGHAQAADSEAHRTADPGASAVHWILLLDATAAIKKEQQFQQIANDLTLARQQLTKQVDQAHRQSLSVSHQAISHQPINPINPLLALPDSTEEVNDHVAKQISILVIKVCQSSLRLSQLNDCLADIAQLVSEENGLIHHVFGPTAVALFGLISTSRSPAMQASRAAKRLLYRLADQPSPVQTANRTSDRAADRTADSNATVPNATADPNIPQYRMALGITTGEATIDTLSHAHQRTINVNGPVISTAFAMRNLLQAGTLKESRHHRFPHTLIVDDLTLQGCHAEFSDFGRHQIHQDPASSLYQLILK